MPGSDQAARYRRNILLPGFGEEGQEKLLQSGVLLAGAGGLASPAALYLAAVGIGRIGLLDGDRVELSNLQRQILHGTPDIGREKVFSARDRLLNLNPHLEVEVHCLQLADDNAEDLINGYNIVLDCTDNFSTRFILNEACLRLKKPFVYGGVLAYTGQLLTVVPGAGPCFRCLYRGEPGRVAQDCSTAGVLGTVPGVIGTLQACEAVKYLAGIGNLLVGRLLVYDALSATFTGLTLERDPLCPSCGAGKPA